MESFLDKEYMLKNFVVPQQFDLGKNDFSKIYLSFRCRFWGNKLANHYLYRRN